MTQTIENVQELNDLASLCDDFASNAKEHLSGKAMLTLAAYILAKRALCCGAYGALDESKYRKLRSSGDSAISDPEACTILLEALRERNCNIGIIAYIAGMKKLKNFLPLDLDRTYINSLAAKYGFKALQKLTA